MFTSFLIALLATVAVHVYVRRTYDRWRRILNTSRLTGREVARALLDANGLQDVNIEATRGWLTDRYDPRVRTVRLSEENYHRKTVAALAVAVHEVGHALQHAHAPLHWRSALVPVVSLGSSIGPWLVLGGALLGVLGLTQLGVVLFGTALLFQLVILPIEFGASRRAYAQMQALELASPQDAAGAKRVLNAAALTYVAAVAASVAFLLHHIVAFTGEAS